MQKAERHYPKRLHHDVPGWVNGGALFHIRLRVDPESKGRLTEGTVANRILGSMRFYHEHQRWCCHLALLMPDHLHALLSFPPAAQMSRVIGEWKKFTTLSLNVRWQSNYFDHRIRTERESAETYDYIVRNPVVKGLCSVDARWPWQWSGQ